MTIDAVNLIVSIGEVMKATIMSNAYNMNDSKLIEQLFRFISFVHDADGHTGFISFRDRDSFLGREEDYKSRIAEEARKELNCNCW